MSETSSDEDPVRLTDADARSLPTWRAAYSDRTAWLMSVFSQLAYVPFVDDQPPPGAPTQSSLPSPGSPALIPTSSRADSRFGRRSISAMCRRFWR